METFINLFNNLLREYQILEKKIKTYYLVIIGLYFVPILVTVIVFNKFMQSSFNLTVKLVIMLFTLGGVGLHFYIRHTHQRKVYRSFFNKRLSHITIDDDGSEYETIIEAIKKLLEEQDVVFINDNNTTSQFWNHVLRYFNFTKNKIYQDDLD